MNRLRRKTRASNESGSILVFVALAMTVLLGFVGLVIDVGQLYVAKQRLQAAADSVAMAISVDLYNGKASQVKDSAAFYSGLNAPSNSTTSYNPGACDAWCSGHMTLYVVSGRVNNVQVTVTNNISLTFLRALGINNYTLTATANAVVALGPETIPMIVLHPTQDGSLTLNGGAVLQICGGPSSALDVNSTSGSSISNGGTIDLSLAGPLDPGNCTSGTGAGLANVGSQAAGSIGTVNFGALPGTYTPNASPAIDPLLVTPEPQTQPGPPAAVQSFPAGQNAYYNCPVACNVYSPGYYSSTATPLITSGFTVFLPGVYWIASGGFQVVPGSIVRMATSATPDPVTTTGMLIYNVGVSASDILNIQAGAGVIGGQTYPTSDCPNGGNCLTGTPVSSPYNGILFFQSRLTVANMAHFVNATNPINLSGSIYFTHKRVTDSDYYTLNWTGPCTSPSTSTTGQIIGDVVIVSGCLQVNLGQEPYLAPGVALAN